MNERDLIGYGRTPPNPNWPGQAQVAVQIVLNYEEGGEKSPLYGDGESESFLLEQPTAPIIGMRNLSAESQYEYGSRVGFWRLYRMLTARNIPVTVFGVTQALMQHPEAVSAMREAGWEIASHGMQWRGYSDLPIDQERTEINKAIRLHTEAVGIRPEGWYTGRMSPNTRSLLVEAGGFLYDSNYFGDDLPFWTKVDGQDHLVIPYTLDNNDMRYLIPYGYQSSSFSAYLIQALDFMHKEGREFPMMMNIGLHNRIVGHAGRAGDLERFLDHLVAKPDVWIARRVDIARHWHEHHKLTD